MGIARLALHYIHRCCSRCVRPLIANSITIRIQTLLVALVHVTLGGEASSSPLHFEPIFIASCLATWDDLVSLQAVNFLSERVPMDLARIT